MVIDEGQQYGTDREIAVLSLLREQPLVLWTGDSQQTPGGIARTAPNAKRSRQILLAKKHGLRSDRSYYMPSTLAEAMVRLGKLIESNPSCPWRNPSQRPAHAGKVMEKPASPAIEGGSGHNQHNPPWPWSLFPRGPAARAIAPYQHLLTPNYWRARQLLDIATCGNPPAHGWRPK